MYFFYIDESGTKDPEVSGVRKDGTPIIKEHLYVLTAVSLYEFHWRNLEREIANLKLELSDSLYRRTGQRFSLADCEVKSVWLRMAKQRAKESPFLNALSNEDITRISEKYFEQLERQKMTLFSVIVDKRKLHGHINQDILFKMAYEFLLERINHFMAENHSKHQALVVIDDNGRQANRSLAMKHAFIQREGNRHSTFRHIVEYPMFTDSALSVGVQLADLCGYNVYRAFRNEDFDYPYFANLLESFYCSSKTDPCKLDGLKVWPPESPLVEFARSGWLAHQTKSTCP